jgi:hypothetical protein
MGGGEMIHDHRTNVVASGLVLLARISEADHDPSSGSGLHRGLLLLGFAFCGSSSSLGGFAFCGRSSDRSLFDRSTYREMHDCHIGSRYK